MILKSPTDNRYYIKPRSVIFSENDMGDPSRVYVSIASGTTIMVNIPDVIPLDEDKQYRKWVLSGFSTKLGTTASYYVYAKLNRSDDRATISFSTKKYEVNGSADGSEASESYFFIAIGTITATDGVSARTLTYDSGKLTTPDNSYTKEEVDNLVKPWEDMFLSRKEDDTAEGHITFEKGITTKSVSMGGKSLSDVATSTDSYKIENPTDSDIATAAYVDAHGKQKFLSKTTDDTAAGRIIFEKGLRSEDDVEIDGGISASGNAMVTGNASIGGNTSIGGDTSIQGKTTLKDKITIGNFIEEGDIIQGAQIAKSGVGSFAGVKSPFMQIYELIYNRKTAVQGEFAFSDGDTVEGVTLNDDGTYTLSLRAQYEGYITSFKYDDIIYANINIIGNSGEAATTGKCWMRVNSIAYDGLTINVSLYSDEQVPSGTNIAPQPHMMITRHGNETDKTRQDVWIISSEDGRMYQLTGVDSPIINSATAYATVWGKLPQNLVEYIQQHVTNFNPQHPYLYARGAVIQDLILLNYKGAVVKTENYRGIWSYETAVNDPYITNESTYDTVTHNGSKWMVQVSNTTVEPSLTVTEWSQIVAKGESASIYEIKPTDNIIYLRENGLSTKSLDVTIGETSTEYVEITSQDELDARGLKVQYAIDGKEPRVDLEIGGTYAIGLEDGSGVIVDEEYDGEEDILMLEGESIDVYAIEDNITLYLVDTETGKDRAKYIIPVVKDGKEGKQGIQGETGRSSFTSIVFLRSNPTPSTPQGGSYESPIPIGWNDGIPDDSEEKIWMSTRIFSSDGMPPQTEEWTKPEVVSSTADMQIIFSSKETPQPPSGDYDETDVDWTEESTSATIWMAIRKKKDGIWGAWKTSKIKGEKGDDGTSIKVKGSLDDESQLPIPPEDASDCYIIGTDLYVWDGTVWKNVGKFAGKDGTPSTRLDLDNNNDSMLYDSEGNLLSGAITSRVTLYVGNDKIQDAQFGISNTNVEAELVDGVITVTACNAASGTVNVTCIYGGTVYTSIMTIKRIVNGVRYEIVPSTNVITYNESSKEFTPSVVNIQVYRTAQSGTGINRELLSSLPDGWFLSASGGSIDANGTITPNEGYREINVELVTSDMKVEDSETIPIVTVKNGENGENGEDGADGEDGHSYTLQALPSTLQSVVDAETGMIMKTEMTEVYCTYMIDGVARELSDGDTVSTEKDVTGTTDVIAFGSLSNGKAKLNVYRNARNVATVKSIKVTVTPADKSLPPVSTDIAIGYPQRGLVGPAGQTGLMLYPQGYWDENTIYTQVKDDEGNAVATPFVYYRNEQGAGDYYVLQQDLPSAGIDPSTDDAQTYWIKFQKAQYVFTEALMANWARLAKSVFWGDYMFSTKGVNQAGEVVDHTAYMGTDNPMFDSNTNRLTGALIPNLFLDLENGLIKTNKLSETFRPFRAKQNYPDASYGDACSDILTLNTSYNVKCKAGVKVLFMPLLTDIKASNGSTYMYADVLDTDGIHSTVSVFPDTEYERLINSSLISINAGSTTLSGLDYQEACGYSVLLCADPRILARSSYKYGLDGAATETKYAPHNVILNDAAFFRDDLDMFLSFGGTLSKWLLLEPGSTVSLRLIESDGQHIWIVENANDFDQLDARIGISFDSSANNNEGFSWITGGVIGLGNSNTDELSDLGINRTGRFYGSKRLRLLYDAQTTKKTVNIGVYVTSNSYADNTTVMEIADEIEGVEISN